MNSQKPLDPFSQAVKDKKEQLYGRLRLNLNQMNWIIGVTIALLCVVIALIALEAAGICKL